ncbi:hypothetical protein GRAQ_03166 [Rahnella aquatilis CIP 78.65 = ATCC 33071]|uniref:MarR family transcriptional regulator n=1 Tax=Rahnella aquatilis (strain ATCC 33071 / DSM 4594 / JCM 1683 / NBRC 105701 / NCIMB 13365 / CIP 78.65) TaxID=745277 RepID=H2IV23_RAHAC|nr:hypothetical protein [Rahnella aquatilis]AEX53937.1 hypothetical protein Rahaq2_4169 [Rahnella aquatilis CIP 78.65 = ATCC 33071]KFD02744.1 hypothetical protein GRAQ_03166 [Rahnella aquatilis CIP 78.65 = ATCC 33071]
MTRKIAELGEYLESVLGFSTRATEVKLPVSFSIQEAFSFFELEIRVPGEASLILLAALQHDDEYPGIVALRKRLSLIEKVTNKVVVYVCENMNLAERRSLIEHHINFIAIKKQFFIPELAMDLREVFRIRKNSTVKNEEIDFSPATQAMLIQLLFDESASKPDVVYTADQLMGSYKYSRVTLSKAISELTKSGLLSSTHKRDFSTRYYSLRFSRSKTFEKALLMMRNPIKKFVWINKIPPLNEGVCYAGDSALAEYTMLARRAKPVFAMTQKVFTSFLKSGEFDEVTHIDSAVASVEIWSYRSPKASTHIVDEISLYLTQKDNQDERVQLALGELKEQYPWMKFGD